MRLQDDAVNYLFNVAPEEPERRKPQKRAKEEKLEESQEEAIVPPSRIHQILGQVRDLHECGDRRCGSRHFDIIDENRGEWLIECMICGTGQRVPVISGILKEPEENFTFRDGIFAGLSVGEAFQQENGPEYVEWAASSHKREAVRKACRSWLDTTIASS
jgi:hypothetical protein